MTVQRLGTRRSPLSVKRIVDGSRALLVEGGTEAIAMREVARRLGTTAPALYKHVAGRDELLALLIASCTDELRGACTEATAAVPDDPGRRLQAASWAFRSWAVAHPAEFGLVYGTPIPDFTPPEDGPTAEAGRRLGAVFADIFADLASAGRLRTVAAADLDASVAGQLEAIRAQGFDLPPEVLHALVVGWQRMLGLVSVEVTGHLRWAFSDPTAFVRAEFDRLLDELTRPAADAPAS